MWVRTILVDSDKSLSLQKVDPAIVIAKKGLTKPS